MKTTDSSIIQLDFSEEMRNSYRDYAVSVIIARALPDIRDGLEAGAATNPLRHEGARTGSGQATS